MTDVAGGEQWKIMMRAIVCMTLGIGVVCCNGETLVVASPPDAGPDAETGVERWVGYIEGGQLPSGSERVELTIRSDGTGTFRAGEPGGDFPPPTDPTIGWPPIDLCNYRGSAVIERLVYPLDQVTREPSRLRMRFLSGAPWKDWCALQKPLPVPPDGAGQVRYVCYDTDADGYRVGPEGCWSLGPSGHPFDCAQGSLCGLELCGNISNLTGGVCQCTETSCTSRDIGTIMDFYVDGDLASGTSPAGNVRLTRVR